MMTHPYRYEIRSVQRDELTNSISFLREDCAQDAFKTYKEEENRWIFKSVDLVRIDLDTNEEVILDTMQWI